MLRLALEVTLVSATVFWLALAVWVNRDARRRSSGYGRVAAATLLGLVPLLGPLAYLLVRSPETRADVHGRQVEIEALESWLAQAPACPTCTARVEDAFLVCPVCTTRLKEPCAGCAAPLARNWLTCPYCTLPVGTVPVSPKLDVALTQEAVSRGIGPRPRATRARKEPRVAAS